MFELLQKATGLAAPQIAGVLGLNPRLVAEWTSGQKATPRWLVPRLASLTGLSRDRLVDSRPRLQSDADSVPAVWFKLRNALEASDLEWVLLIRQLGHLIGELEEVTQRRTAGWESLFASVLSDTDLQAPPREQGRIAGRLFRAQRTLDAGATGIGDVLRGNLRAVGVLVVEIAFERSALEGCAFYVGDPTTDRPCVFANTYRSTWFRRNAVLAHEIAHAIFDAPQSAVTLDFKDRPTDDLVEERAQAFAKAVLLPPEVLRHSAQRHGVNWSRLTADDLAQIVADTHVEQKLVLEVAEESGLIGAADVERAQGLNITAALKRVSPHALSTREWAKRAGELSKRLSGRRRTTVSTKSMNLPVPYIQAVLDACDASQISDSKAAELLMIHESDFADRFRTRKTA